MSWSNENGSSSTNGNHLSAKKDTQITSEYVLWPLVGYRTLLTLLILIITSDNQDFI